MERHTQHLTRYLAPLDGIRAIAIIAVLIFHVSPKALPGGFIGVDIFFVLSGFLITSILLPDLQAGRFSIREFYLRRFQRLLPNIIVMVLAVVLLWTIFLPPSTARQTGNHGLWTLFNASNIYIWRNLGGYWGNSAEWAPLTHTWSLGIEEQFYLCFPFGLLLLAKYKPERVRSWLLVAAALSFSLCVYGMHSRPVATFYFLPTRVWELLLGAALAAHRNPLSGAAAQLGSLLSTKTREAIGWAGLALIGAGFFVIGAGDLFPGWWGLVPTLGTVVLLVSVVDGETRVSRWLSSRFMVGTGKLSYSLYLWHWPLITLGKIQADFYGFPQLAGAVIGGLAGILIGWLAYVWVEQPLRNRGPGRWGRVVKITVGFAAVALYAGFVALRPCVADPAHRFEKPSFSIKLYDVGRDPETQLATSERFYDVHFPPVPARPLDCWRTGGIIHRYGGGQPKVVVLGSSHALMYSKLVDDICREHGISVAFLGADIGTSAFFDTTVNSNFPTPAEAAEFDQARKKWLREWQPETVFAIDRWDARADRNSQMFDRKLRDFLKEVSPLAKRIVFVAQVPVPHVGNQLNLREFVTWRMGKAKDLPRLNPDSAEVFRKQTIITAEAVAADFKNLRVLRADKLFYHEDGSVRYAAGQNFFYADDSHLSDAGSEVVRDLFQREIIPAQSSKSAP